MQHDGIDKPVLSVEADGVVIVFEKDVSCVYERVVVAEETIYSAAVLAETLLCQFAVFFHYGFRDDHLLHAVLPRVEECQFANHAVTAHRVAHLESRVDEDAVVSV